MHRNQNYQYICKIKQIDKFIVMQRSADIYANFPHKDIFFKIAQGEYSALKKRKFELPNCENPQWYVSNEVREMLAKPTTKVIDLVNGVDITESYVMSLHQNAWTKETRMLLHADVLDSLYTDPLSCSDRDVRSQRVKMIAVNDLPKRTQKQFNGDLTTLVSIVGRYYIQHGDMLYPLFSLTSCGRCKYCASAKQGLFCRKCDYEQMTSVDGVVLFQTLTYTNATIPLDKMGMNRGVADSRLRHTGVLCKRDVQLFFKRLKKQIVEDNSEYQCSSYRYVEGLGYVYCVSAPLLREDGTRNTIEETIVHDLDGKAKKHKRIVVDPIPNPRYHSEVIDERTYICTNHKGVRQYLVHKSRSIYDDSKIRKFKFAYSGEYGGKSGHPHYHCVYFNFPLRFSENALNDYLVERYVQPLVNYCWCGTNLYGNETFDALYKETAIKIANIDGKMKVEQSESLSKIRKNLKGQTAGFRGLGQAFGKATKKDIEDKDTLKYYRDKVAYVALNPVVVARDAGAYISKYISKGTEEARGDRKTFICHSTKLAHDFIKQAFDSGRVTLDGISYVDRNGKQKTDTIPSKLLNCVLPQYGQFVNYDNANRVKVLHNKVKDLEETLVNSLLFYLYNSIKSNKVFKKKEYVYDSVSNQQLYVDNYYYLLTDCNRQQRKLYMDIPLENLYLQGVNDLELVIGTLWCSKHRVKKTFEQLCELHDLLQYYSVDDDVLHSYDMPQLKDIYTFARYAFEKWHRPLTKWISEKSLDTSFSESTFCNMDKGFSPLTSEHRTAISQFNRYISNLVNQYVVSGQPTYSMYVEKDEVIKGAPSLLGYLQRNFGVTYSTEEIDSFNIKSAESRKAREEETPIYFNGRFYHRATLVSLESCVGYDKFRELPNFFGLPYLYIARLIKTALMGDSKLNYVLGLTDKVSHREEESQSLVKFSKMASLSESDLIDALKDILKDAEPRFAFTDEQKQRGEGDDRISDITLLYEVAFKQQAQFESADRMVGRALATYPLYSLRNSRTYRLAYRLACTSKDREDATIPLDVQGVVGKYRQRVMKRSERLASVRNESKRYD